MIARLQALLARCWRFVVLTWRGKPPPPRRYGFDAAREARRIAAIRATLAAYEGTPRARSPKAARLRAELAELETMQRGA